MILSGHEIRAQLGKNIVIDPFDESRLNPNSYNLTLHHELMVYEEVVLDMRKENRVDRLRIPPGGLMLQPNQLYLGCRFARVNDRAAQAREGNPQGDFTALRARSTLRPAAAASITRCITPR